MNSIDWSATAAWTALIISIVGSIIGPIISAIFTNRHQLKMHQLSSYETQLSRYNESRSKVFSDFVSCVGKCIAFCNNENLADCGAAYFQIYQYIPKTYWDSLDKLYVSLCETDLDTASSIYPQIIHLIGELSKEEPPQFHK